MAGEFYFFSQLHRLGYEAYITFGNTKGIDISVKLKTGIFTFEVKSLLNFNGSYQYLNITKRENHFVVFVNLNIKKEESDKAKILDEPKCYIVDSLNLGLIASDWVSSTGSAKGYGFEAKLLQYLKNDNKRGITEDLIKKFKERHDVPGDINLELYKEKILSIEDFENSFYTKK